MDGFHDTNRSGFLPMLRTRAKSTDYFTVSLAELVAGVPWPLVMITL